MKILIRTYILLLLSFSTNALQAMQSKKSEFPNQEEREKILDEAISLECSICSNALFHQHNKEKIYKTACDHLFHAGCITKALTDVGASCPLCRFDLSFLFEQSECLLAAVESNDSQKMDDIIKSGALVDLWPKRRGPAATLLLYAANCGLTTAMRVLLNTGANVNARGPFLWTVLHEILDPKSNVPENVILELIPLLVQEGIDLEAKTCAANGECTALFFASQSRSPQIARALMLHGAKTDTRNKFNMNLLHASARCGNSEVVKMLIDEYHFSVDDTCVTDSTPLHHAAIGTKGNQMETARVLLERGAKRDLRNNTGNTPEELALEVNRNTQLAEFIKFFKRQSVR